MSEDSGSTWNYSKYSDKYLFGSYIGNLVSDPGNPAILYLAGWFGVAKSVDFGASWKLTNKGLNALWITSMAFSKNNNTILASTMTAGLWKTGNFGKDWVQLDVNGGDLIVDPNNPDHIFSGTFETTNGGTDWTDRSFPYQSIKFAANSDLYGVPFNENNIYKSNDNGNTWTITSSNPIGCYDCTFDYITTDPVDSNIIYMGMYKLLLISDPATGYCVIGGFLFKSTDGGNNWEEIGIGQDDIYTGYFQHHSLSIDPYDHNTLYLGASGVYKSTDGGKNWIKTTFVLAAYYKMINSIIIDPVNTKKLYVCTAGEGIYRSLDGGISWEKFNTGLDIGNIFTLLPISEDQGGVFLDKPGIQSVSPASRKTRVIANKGTGVSSYFSVDYPPSSITLSSSSISGNLPIYTNIGSFSSIDQNSPEKFYYSLVPGEGDTDNSVFKIVGSTLKSAIVFDQSSKNNYSIRVRSSDTGGLFFEKSFPITITANTAAPFLVSPGNDAILLDSIPVLDWDDVPSGLSYNIQVSKNNTFTSLVLNSKSINSSLNLSKALPSLNVLFWRVRAYYDTKSKVAGPWSGIGVFNPPNPPYVTKLSLPKNNSKIKILNPTLVWTRPSLPAGTAFAKYEVEIAIDPAFSSIYLDTNIIGYSLSSYPIYLPLSHLTKYYWRVRSFNTNEQPSSWSGVFSFTTP